MSTNPTSRIAERRRFITEKAATLEKELDQLRSELTELDIAERVLQRFTEPQSVATRNGQLPLSNGMTDDAIQIEPPTLPQMVFTLLEEAKASGRRGLDASEILAAVQARWKPEFTGDNVRPTLWRMAKHQRLRKRGRTYSLPVSSPEGETGAVGAPVQH